MKAINKKNTAAISIVSLFSSFSTLICCALPALLVTLGAGAALAGLLSAVPQIIWISEYKITVFTLAGLMLAGSGFLIWRQRSAPCPTEENLAKSCMRLRKLSTVLYLSSVGIYAIGFFFSFLAAKIL